MSASRTTRRLTRPTDAEWARVIDVLQAALFNDKVVLCITGASKAAERAMYRQYAEASLRDGEVWVAGPNGQIHAVALWIGPGRDEPSIIQDPYRSLLSEETRHWILHHYTPQYRELYASAYASGSLIRTQSWHLRFIGVEPQHQRQGLGRALMGAMLNNGQHQAHTMATDVSTLSAVYFFQQFGFVHRGVKNFTSRRASFPMWCLLKEASPPNPRR
ncbi:hypothetical protein OF83DRAFT_316167 [Amylostereum chailletii]|nr:hypothetical protein OF83DRAFT_316167 [Amylostereum chailletii]